MALLARPLLLIICFSLASCAVYEWRRPETTQQQFHIDMYECQREAATSFPSSIVQTTLKSGYQAPDQIICTDYGIQAQCSATRGTSSPPVTVISDANQASRDGAAKSCMYARGYAYDRKANETTGTAARASSRPEPQVFCLADSANVGYRFKNGSTTMEVTKIRSDDAIECISQPAGKRRLVEVEARS